jgi:hypothetical protein
MSLKSLLKMIPAPPLAAKFGIVVGVVMAGYIVALKAQNAHLTSQFVIETMRANNELAAKDSTRRVILAKNDTIHAWEKLTVQEKVRGDDLDKQLKRETRLKAALQLKVDSLVAVIQGKPTTEDSAGTRFGIFDAHQAPYTVHAQVALPKPPAAGTMSMTVKLDSILVAVRAQCGAANAVGVRPAVILVEGPTWATLGIGNVTQSPEVCMPQLAPVNVAKSHFKLGAAVGAGLVILSHIFLKVP